MLDYSDDEIKSQLIRRRISPYGKIRRVSAAMKVGLRPREFLKNTDSNSLAALTFNSKSIPNGKSGKLKMSTTNFPADDAFIIKEFIQDKTISISELQNFSSDLKGTDSISGKDKPEVFSRGFIDHPDSFFKSMRNVVLLAEVFGAMPVSGVRGPNYKSILFKWMHYKTAYWTLVFLGTFFCFVCATFYGLGNGSLTQTASEVVYFASGVLSSLVMLNLSRNWAKICKEFSEVEFRMKQYGYPKKVKLKFTVFTVVMLLAALVEHLMGKIRSMELASHCAVDKRSFFALTQAFFILEYPEVFSLFPYSLWKGLLVFASQFLTTANWNIKDLLLCLISWSIAERFQQVHKLLDTVHGQEKPVSFWKKVREDYNHLSVLTKRVDVSIQKLMFLSIGNNLFFICIQLLNSLKKKLQSIKIVYFFWSFGFLLLRTSVVAFSAARINDESKEPKIVLYSVPQKNYSAEVRRFLTQLTTNEVALTGSNFFAVTRSLILTITGSVITYEIVLVQFNGSDVGDDIMNGNHTICLGP